jgi:hypothetical protein
VGKVSCGKLPARHTNHYPGHVLHCKRRSHRPAFGRLNSYCSSRKKLFDKMNCSAGRRARRGALLDAAGGVALRYIVLKACSVVVGLSAFVAPVLVIKSAPTGQSCGLFVIPMLFFAGSSLFSLLGVAYVIEKSAELSRKQPWPPDMLRFLALSYAKDGKFDDAIRWQTEALRFAPRKWIAAYRAELERYRIQKNPGADSSK